MYTHIIRDEEFGDKI